MFRKTRETRRTSPLTREIRSGDHPAPMTAAMTESAADARARARLYTPRIWL